MVMVTCQVLAAYVRLRVTLNWFHQHHKQTNTSTSSYSTRDKEMPAFGPSTSAPSSSSSFSSRYSLRISNHSTVPASTVIAVEQHAPLVTTPDTTTPLPNPLVQFEIPYNTIDVFFHDKMMLSLASSDTPPVYLVLDAVPSAALPTIQLYIESIAERAKYLLSIPLGNQHQTDTRDRIDYSHTTKKLIITCASREHRFMANIEQEMMRIVTSDDDAFTGNDPDYQIVGVGDSRTFRPASAMKIHRTNLTQLFLSAA